MASAQAGNQGDYRVLLGELAGVLAKYLCTRIGAGPYVDDCVQEVLMAVHEARHTYDPARPFRPWLFAIAQYKAVDHLRRETRLREDPLPEEAGEWESGDPGLEDAVGGGRLIASLDVEYREPILLTKILGLSGEEAARKLKISESTLKVRVHRGIKRLRNKLAAETL